MNLNLIIFLLIINYNSFLEYNNNFSFFYLLKLNVIEVKLEKKLKSLINAP